MSRVRWYVLEDRTPRPVQDELTWSKWYGDASLEMKRVAYSILDGPCVSTIFLGLDHSWYEAGPPILFETMIFWDGHNDLDKWCDRYATWDEAEAGHCRAVDMVAEAINATETEA